MVVGTLVAALAAYLFQLIAGRALGPDEFAPITVLWTLQFLVFTTVFVPMEQLTIRRLNIGAADAAPWRLFLWLIGVSVAGAVVFSALTLDQLLEGEPIYLIATAVLITGYGGFALGRGFLAGQRRFREYGLSTLAESVLRLVLAVGLLAAGAEALGLAWTLVAGSLVIYLWRPFQGVRARERGAPVEPGTGGALAAFITANAASQTIVAAGPLVVGALDGSPTEVSVFFETFLLFRAPLTVTYSLVARVLPPFTRWVEQGRRAVIRNWALRLGIGAAVLAPASFVVGTTVGPALVELMLGAEFRPTRELAGYAAAGVVIATIALFMQQFLIARRATRRLAAAWMVGLAASVIVIALAGGTPSIRVGRAFLIGEAVAFVGLLAAVVVRSQPVDHIATGSPDVV